MIPTPFDYSAPESVAETIAILRERGDDAKILAGGHSLIPLLRLHLAAPALLVDLRQISDLRSIRQQPGTISIGAMTPYVDIETSDLVRQTLPLLAEATGMIGDMQVRNRGTIGGALAHADPASDLSAVATALRARIVIQGPAGERVLGMEDFTQDLWTTSLEPDEVVTEIRFARTERVPGSAYEKFRHRAADWAMVGVAATLDVRDGAIEDAAVVLTNVGPTPHRAVGVEDALRGRSLDSQTLASASSLASDGLDPSPELRASPEYKQHLARILTLRALRRAAGTAREG